MPGYKSGFKYPVGTGSFITLAKSSCCCLNNSSSGMPRFSSLVLCLLLFAATALQSFKTASASKV